MYGRSVDPVYTYIKYKCGIIYETIFIKVLYDKPFHNSDIIKNQCNS